MNCPYTTRENIFKNKMVLLMWLENLITPVIRSWNVRKNKNKAVTKVIVKVELPLPNLENLAVLMISHDIWHGPIITRDNFCKNKAVLFKWFENLVCNDYEDLKFWRKKVVLLERLDNIMMGWSFLKNKAIFMSRWNVNCSYYYKHKRLQKYLLFEHLNFPHYHDV